VPGAQIYDVVVHGDRLIGIQGTFERVKVPVDPDDPSQRNVLLPFGQVTLVSPSGNSVTRFPLPPDRITLAHAGADGSQVQARLVPSSLAAYDAALSPDGAHLVFASR